MTHIGYRAIQSNRVKSRFYRRRMYQGMDKVEAEGHFKEEEVTLEDGEEVDLL